MLEVDDQRGMRRKLESGLPVLGLAVANGLPPLGPGEFAAARSIRASRLMKV